MTDEIPAPKPAQPALADALDGLQDAERYCEDVGLDDLAEQCAETYQAVALESPDWGDA